MILKWILFVICASGIDIVSSQCDPGYSGGNGFECTACVPGKHKATNASGTCESCPPGTYNSEMASAFCQACPTGSHSSIESTALTACVCNPGSAGAFGLEELLLYDFTGNLADSDAWYEYANSIGATISGKMFTSGSVGNFYLPVPSKSAGVDLQQVTFTTANTAVGGHLTAYLNDIELFDLRGGGTRTVTYPLVATTNTLHLYIGGSTVLNPNLVIRFSGNVSTCAACVIGTYKSGTGPGTCQLCPAGKYNLAPRANSTDSCIPCAVGKYLITAPINNQTETCVDCPAGTFNSEEAGHGVQSCKQCKKGKYNSKSGSVSENECVHCPKGKFHRATGVTSVDECKECTCK